MASDASLVLEASTRTQARFAGELLHPTGTQVLDDLGFLPTLRHHGGVDVDGFAVVKAPKVPVTRLPYGEIENNRPTGFAMEHRDLVTGMRGEWAQKQPGITFRFNEKVEEILRNDRGRVCGPHRKWNPACQLGARLRWSSFENQTAARAERKCAAAVVFGGDATSDGTKLLPCPTFGHIFLGAWGPMLIYPIGGPDGSRDARGCFDVTRELSGGRKARSSCSSANTPHTCPEPLAKALIESLDRELPQIAANEAIRTDQAVLPGAAIVGDAGGCAHPLTAAGMTVCFTDAQRLGRLLRHAGDFSDMRLVDTALRQYEIDRYRFVRVRELLTDALYEVFRGAEPGTRAIREGIFRYWESSKVARLVRWRFCRVPIRVPRCS